MAAAELVRLTELHRLAQARLGARTAQAMLDTWAVLDVADLDGTFPAWLRTVTPVVGAARAESARLAGQYMTLARQSADVPGRGPLVLADQVPVDQLTASLLVTGPGAVKSALARGVVLERAVDVARARAAAAGMRHALNGGRDTVVGSVKRDRRAVGWARATSGSACHFCRMLAGRGPVYKSQESASFPAHDGCHCSAAAVWSREDPWPAGAVQSKALWEQSTQGLSGADARRAFRRAVEGR